MLLLKGIAIIALLGIGVQDFKYKAVFWWLFPLVMFVLTPLAYQQIGFAELVQTSGINSLFLGTQLLFISLYFSIKQRRWVNIFSGYFGLGDLLFLLSITVAFSLYNFICFYVISIFFVIILTVISKSIFKNESSKIPLAGYQALMFLGLLFFMGKNCLSLLLSDSLLYQYFNL